MNMGSSIHGAPKAPQANQSVQNNYNASQQQNNYGFSQQSSTPYNFSKPPTQWYYADNESKQGPFDDAQFKSMLGTQIQGDTLVWKEDMDNWAAAEEVPELAASFQSSKRMVT